MSFILATRVTDNQIHPCDECRYVRPNEQIRLVVTLVDGKEESKVYLCGRCMPKRLDLGRMFRLK